MEKLNVQLAELLYSRFAAIYGDKFVKSSHDKKFIALWCEEWISGLADINVYLIKGAIDECKLMLDWPPTICEFRKLCEKGAGFPSYETCLASAIRGNFNHAIVYLAYQKIGKWTLQNDKEDILRKKFEVAYSDALAEYRINKNQCEKLLEEYLTKPKTVFLENNKPTKTEIKSFKEQLKIYQERALKDKQELEKIPHPNWEPNYFRQQSKSFRLEIYKERRNYLLNLTDREAATLPQEEWYDRIKYKRELEGIEHLNRVGYSGKD